MLINNLNREIVYPKVNVYRNALSNHKDLLQILKESEKNIPEDSLFTEWKDWYGLGIMMNLGLPTNRKPTITNSNHPIIKDQEKFLNDVANIFFQTTDHYINEWDIDISGWQYSGLSVCKYNISREDQELAMTYHTDYYGPGRDRPGLKFGITCTVYLNDDYDGGEISFLHMDTGDIIDYKPKAGDIVVFPSDEPYYHGVKGIHGDNKYFIRIFWQWNHLGSEEWLANQEKYGKEKWEEICKENEKKELESGKYHRYIVEEGQIDPGMDRATPFYKKGYKQI